MNYDSLPNGWVSAEDVDPEQARREMITSQFTDNLLGQLEVLPYEALKQDRIETARAEFYFNFGLVIEDEEPEEKQRLLDACTEYVEHLQQLEQQELMGYTAGDETVDNAVILGHPTMETLAGALLGIEKAREETSASFAVG